MKIVKSERRFEFLEHEVYPPGSDRDKRVVSQSSAIRDNPFGPGSSCLWFGENHHLNREEVAQVVAHLQEWLKTGSLDLTENEMPHRVTVEQLIEELQKQNPKAILVMSSDSEGNKFSPMHSLSQQMYVADWGEITRKELTEEDRVDGLTEDDLCPEGMGEEAIVFWPE